MMPRKCLLGLLLALCLLVSPARAEETRVVRVGFFAFEGYHMVGGDGAKSGYGYDYLQHAARYTNWRYEYVGYERAWSEMLGMLRAGEIDMVTSAQMTDAREAEFAYSERPIGTSAAILTVRAGDARYLDENYALFDGIRVGLLTGSSRNAGFANFAREAGFQYKSVYYTDTDALVSALASGERIDAAVTSSLRKTQNEWIIAEFDPSPFYAVVRKGDESLLAELNYAVGQIELLEPDLTGELYEKYYSADTGDEIAFTLEERAFIREASEAGTAFTAAMRPDLPPLSYFEDGQAKGIIAALCGEIARRAGLEIEIVASDSQAAYESLVNSGGADLVLDMPCDLYYAESLGYKITDAYLRVPNAALRLTKTDEDGAGIAAAVKGMPVNERHAILGAGDNSALYFDTTRDAARAVLGGQADVLYTDVYGAARAVYDDVTGALEYATLYSLYDDQFAIAARGNHLLVSILGKAAASLGDAEAEAIVAAQTAYPARAFSVVRFLYEQPVFAVCLIALFFAAVIALLIVAARARQRREEQKQRHELSRFVGYVCEANDEVAEYNLRTDARALYRIRNGQPETVTESGAGLSAFLARVHPEDRALAARYLNADALQEVIDAESAVYFECRALGEGERYRWYGVTAQGLTRDEEHPENVMLYKRDIDESKREEARKQAALEDALDAARQASGAKSQFLSRVSHEIRTPLNAIIGYMTIAESNPDDMRKNADCLAKGKLAARHLLNVLNDVLDMASIESGKMRLTEKPFDVRELLGSISEMYYAQARKANLRFNAAVQNLECEVLVGDELRLSQILHNLLSNAVKFTPAGGEVILRAEQKRALGDTAHLHFEVRDTGVGIDKAFMAKLFQPFERETSAPARPGGTGLGLAITRNLVSMMNGTIRCDSEPGKGSTFIVELPFRLESEKAAGATVYDFSSVRTLMVDEDAEGRDYLVCVARNCGAQSDAAASRDEAIDKLLRARNAGAPYDLCLTYWREDGEETTRMIRRVRAEIGATTPLLVVSAYDSKEIEKDALDAGANLVVPRPLFQSTFFNILVTFYAKREEIRPLADAKPDFQGARVLLAEDNEMNMEIATELLKEAGLRVTGAKNGAEAVSLFEASAPGDFDAILMDVMMPVMDGYEATKRIRALDRPDAATIPILAMTANAFREDVSAALAAGMNDHVAKPIDVGALFAALAKYVRGTQTPGGR